jgi:hypothetical protein
VQRLAVEEPSIIAAISKEDKLTIVVSDKKSTRLIMKQTFGKHPLDGGMDMWIGCVGCSRDFADVVRFRFRACGVE